MRFICWLNGFVGTWLDPRMWGVATFDGHLYDVDARTYEVKDGREYEFMPCVRCHRVLESGWRSMP